MSRAADRCTSSEGASPVTATGRRSIVKPGKYAEPWAHNAAVVLVHTGTTAWGQRDFDLLVDGMKIGEVEAHPVLRAWGRGDLATEWRGWSVKDGARVGERHCASKVRYWAVAGIVTDYLRERGAP